MVDGPPRRPTAAPAAMQRAAVEGSRTTPAGLAPRPASQHRRLQSPDHQPLDRPTPGYREPSKTAAWASNTQRFMIVSSGTSMAAPMRRASLRPQQAISSSVVTPSA